MPSNCVFGDKGPAVILSDDNRQDLLAILAVTNSEAFISCVELQLAAADAAARSYEVGVIQRTPLPCIQAEDGAALAELARRAWSLKRQLDTANENSHAFTLPAALQADGQTLSDRAGAWASCERVAEPELTAIQAEIDSRCFDLYGIAQPDRQPITESSCADDDAGSAAGEPEDELSDDTDEDATESSCDNLPTLIADLVSWAVGVALGRFDVRFAIGARSIPAEPEPFDPLPVCSPGILADGDGLPIVVPPPEYPVRFPVDGLLVDDPGHPNDLPAAIRRVFELVFAESSDARWTEAATLLDPAGHDLRRWLSSEFFDSHLRRYSKSRRKAPIYCQVATPSRRYSLWLYAHHLTRDTLFHIQQELLGPKLSHEEHRLLSLIQEAGPNPTASQRKSLADQQAFVEELRIMRDEVARVAPLWNPDLDDGVAITMAPLWRLVPQHRAWQRELQSTWEALAAGKYDWAHLAMHLWPERVVPKCAEDRSLAIAHGLEDVFWEENSDGRWKRRLSPSRSIEELVRERTSLAVKDALKSLMEAPAPGGGGRATRSRRGRAVGGR
jgi:hypothetical protein